MDVVWGELDIDEYSHTLLWTFSQTVEMNIYLERRLNQCMGN